MNQAEYVIQVLKTKVGELTLECAIYQSEVARLGEEITELKRATESEADEAEAE